MFCQNLTIFYSRVRYPWDSNTTGLMIMHSNQRIDFRDLRARTQREFPAVLAHFGLQAVGTGDQVRIRCPFHDDEHPSCSVNLAQGVWKCHAGCGEGNLLEFTHKMLCKDGAVFSMRQAGHELAAICRVEVKALEKSPGNGARTRQDGRRA